MAITVAMIEEKEFKIKMRGYDPSEVDEFLDEICDEMVALQEEIATLNQRLSQSAQVSAYAPAAVPTPVAPAPAPVPAPVVPVPAPAPVKKEEPAPQKADASEAAQKLLSRAQKVYDDTLADARQEAQEILDEAKQKAAEQIGSLEAQRNSLLKEVDELKAAARDYRERFQRLIEDQAHILKTDNALFQ